MTISAYLAARYSRRAELNDYRRRLEREGVTVTSRWLTGEHEWSGTPDDAIPVAEQGRFAQEDLDDIDRSDVLILFADPPDGYGTRGGAQFEAGYALSQGIELVVVSHRQHVFCCLPDVVFCPDPEAAIAYVVGLRVGSSGKLKVA